VIEHDATADPCSGVNVDLENAGRETLQIEREIVPPDVPKDVGEAERFERVVALEIEQRIDQTPASRRIKFGALASLPSSPESPATLLKNTISIRSACL
jgi:hypothetical protein